MQPRCKLDVLKVVTVLGHELQHQGLLGALHALAVVREPLHHFVLPLVHEARQYPELPIHVGKHDWCSRRCLKIADDRSSRRTVSPSLMQMSKSKTSHTARMLAILSEQFAPAGTLAKTSLM
eukprot:5942539-Pyramimonas_sp.AAC.1